MIYFIKKKDEHNQFDRTDITVKTDAITLSELIEEFSYFLMACGFNAEGVREDLGLVEPEDTEGDK